MKYTSTVQCLSTQTTVLMWILGNDISSQELITQKHQQPLSMPFFKANTINRISAGYKRERAKQKHVRVVVRLQAKLHASFGRQQSWVVANLLQDGQVDQGGTVAGQEGFHAVELDEVFVDLLLDFGQIHLKKRVRRCGSLPRQPRFVGCDVSKTLQILEWGPKDFSQNCWKIGHHPSKTVCKICDVAVRRVCDATVRKICDATYATSVT